MSLKVLEDFPGFSNGERGLCLFVVECLLLCLGNKTAEKTKLKESYPQKCMFDDQNISFLHVSFLKSFCNELKS